MSYEILEDYNCEKDDCGFGIRLDTSKCLLDNNEVVKNKDYSRTVCLVEFTGLLKNKDASMWNVHEYSTGRETVISYKCPYCGDIIKTEGFLLEKEGEKNLMIHTDCWDSFKHEIDEFIKDNLKLLISSAI